MAPSSARLCALLALTTLAATQSLSAIPTNTTSYKPSVMNSATDLALVVATSNYQGAQYNIIPLTNSALSVLQPGGQDNNGINGQFVYVNASTSSVEHVTPKNVAFIDCDPSGYPGNINLSTVLDSQISDPTVTAVVLYSLTSSFCALTGSPGNFAFFYSLTNISDAQQLTGMVTPINMAYFGATIETQATAIAANTGPGGTTTAVAMIILYSITGVITALFLLVIVAGAIRAHRHPERYGPRQVLGRPRQSRAKGIARAMLDTLPIVKFSGPSEKPPEDVELATSAVPVAEHPPPAASAAVEQEKALLTEEHIATHADAGDVASSSGEVTELQRAAAVAFETTAPTAPAAGTSKDDSAYAHDNSLGCSICTDDFENGQDIRVLPCNHKFHPACVDPWLLDVSGTCPLCRVDLHPTTSKAGEAPTTSDNPLPPPLNTSASTFRRRDTLSSLFSNRAMQSANPDERLAVLRRFRNQNRTRGAQASPTSPTAADAFPAESSRLRSILGRRTR